MEPLGRGERQSAARSAGSRRGRGAVLLDASGAQTRETVRLVGALPGAEFLLAELVAAAGLLNGDLAALHRGDDRRLAAHHPSSSIDGRQVSHGMCSDRRHAKAYSPESCRARSTRSRAASRFWRVWSRATAYSSSAARSAAATVPWVGSAQAVGQRVMPLVRMNAATAARYSSLPMMRNPFGERPPIAAGQ